MIELHGKTFTVVDHQYFSEWEHAFEEQNKPTFTIKDNDVFLITDRMGNVAGDLLGDEHFVTGLFCHDTRFLSRSELQIDGRSPVLLSSGPETGFSLSVACTNPHLSDDMRPHTIEIQRDIVLRGGLFETIELCNYNRHPVKFQISLSFDADFKDLFEVRKYLNRTQRGKLLKTTAEIAPDFITLAYVGLDNLLMESRIQFLDRKPDYFKSYTAVWEIELNAQEVQKLSYRLQMFTDNQPTSQVNAPLTLAEANLNAHEEQQEWFDRIARFSSDNILLDEAIAQTEKDIYLLRQSFGEAKVLAAGIPWFSTLFGRDALISASQTLAIDPAIARDTLIVLARYQGKISDDWREEDPGKILHEIRLGEMARCHEIAHTPYYGTVDATPLWLMLYAEYLDWTNDVETIDRLWPNALAAMEWIDRQCKATGYLGYLRRSDGGINNQGWKDSWECIVDRQGELARGPIYLCEVQAYVYAAKQRLSKIARRRQQYELSERWAAQAADLKLRFNRDFWVDSQNFCALALDGEGKLVDSITSNPGHCLSLGILDSEKAIAVAKRLCEPDMFSGWGIRTLNTDSPTYNPMGYHLGTVWPHDNSIVAMGLRNTKSEIYPHLNFTSHAFQLFQGLVDMTLKQPLHRLPELICGYERSGDKGPVRYPVACSPQAWAAGSIFQLLQAIVNPIPNAEAKTLRIVNPALPPSLNRLTVRHLKVGDTLLDLEFDRLGDTTACRVTKLVGKLEVAIEI